MQVGLTLVINLFAVVEKSLRELSSPEGTIHIKFEVWLGSLLNAPGAELQ